MKTNMGVIDRVVRTLIAVTVLLMYSLGMISGTLAVIGLIVAGAFLLTSFISFCPLYTLFKLSTKRKIG